MLSTDSSPSFSWSLLTDFAWRHHKFIKRLGVKRVVLVRENSQLQHPILQNLEKSYNSRVYSFVQSEPHLQVDIHVLVKGKAITPGIFENLHPLACRIRPGKVAAAGVDMPGTAKPLALPRRRWIASPANPLFFVRWRLHQSQRWRCSYVRDLCH